MGYECGGGSLHLIYPIPLGSLPRTYLPGYPHGPLSLPHASVPSLLMLCPIPSCPLRDSPEGIGGDDEDQGDDMVDEHDH